MSVRGLLARGADQRARVACHRKGEFRALTAKSCRRPDGAPDRNHPVSSVRGHRNERGRNSVRFNVNRNRIGRSPTHATDRSDHGAGRRYPPARHALGDDHVGHRHTQPEAGECIPDRLTMSAGLEERRIPPRLPIRFRGGRQGGDGLRPGAHDLCGVLSAVQRPKLSVRRGVKKSGPSGWQPEGRMAHRIHRPRLAVLKAGQRQGS